MEDSFKLRVDKIFGTLNSASSSSSSSSAPASSSLDSLWCLTDDEIERREWNRDKGSPEPESCSQASVFSNRRDETVYNSNRACRSELEKDLEDLDEDNEINDDEELQVWRSPSRSGKPEDYNDEEWEVKSSIGLDCTLDNEVFFFSPLLEGFCKGFLLPSSLNFFFFPGPFRSFFFFFLVFWAI